MHTLIVLNCSYYGGIHEYSYVYVIGMVLISTLIIYLYPNLLIRVASLVDRHQSVTARAAIRVYITPFPRTKADRSISNSDRKLMQ
ncbi:hypothetical protein MYVALT_F_00620 [Candidatus Vallotia tarda]|uniref:Uncharacterized protein n=1 Tax=Candidatus Vallotiella hemipterorum TaxID=1177213 RepID=A0A916JSE2_9BURK|nr:hypothetical protein MYVALT_F_00620 [Candidatus Vallotia tarda]